jgi:hypothetical protein
MSNGFHVCLTCDGAGFLRAGDFANRSFPRCTKCEGIGQVYLDHAPARVAPDRVLGS